MADPGITTVTIPTIEVDIDLASVDRFTDTKHGRLIRISYHHKPHAPVLSGPILHFELPDHQVVVTWPNVDSGYQLLWAGSHEPAELDRDIAAALHAAWEAVNDSYQDMILPAILDRAGTALRRAEWDDQVEFACRHAKEFVGRVSWPSDLHDVAEQGRPHASEYVCARRACQDHAAAVIERATGHRGQFVPVPALRRNSSAQGTTRLPGIDEVTLRSLQRSKTSLAVIRAIAEAPGRESYGGQIAERTGQEATAVYGAINKLIEQDLVQLTRVERAKHGTPRRYVGLTHSGFKAARWSKTERATLAADRLREIAAVLNMPDDGRLRRAADQLEQHEQLRVTFDPAALIDAVLGPV